MNHCPYCGKPLPQEITAPWQAIQHTNFHAAPWQQPVGTPTPAFVGSYERRAPARTPELIGDVAVPVSQSLITGTIAGAIGWAATGSPIGGAIAGGIALGITWFVLLGEHRRGLWIIEKITGKDLDGDGQAGQPPAQPAAPVKVELHEDNSRRIRIVDLPIPDAKLGQLARAVLRPNSPTPFSRRELTKSILTDSEYRELAAAMQAAGLLAAKGKSQNAGVELTHAGRAILKKFT